MEYLSDHPKIQAEIAVKTTSQIVLSINESNTEPEVEDAIEKDNSEVSFAIIIQNALNIQNIIVDAKIGQPPGFALEKNIGRLESKLSGSIEKDLEALHWIEKKGLDNALTSKNYAEDNDERSSSSSSDESEREETNNRASTFAGSISADGISAGGISAGGISADGIFAGTFAS